MISKILADRCTTHHCACDCREYQFEKMRKALEVIFHWSLGIGQSHALQESILRTINEAAKKAMEGADAT